MEEDEILEEKKPIQSEELKFKEFEKLDLNNVDERVIIGEVLNEEPLTPEIKQQLVQIIESRFEQVTSGPLPSSREMEGYAQIDPNIINFVLEGAKSEQDHRHKMHQQEFELTVKDQQDSINLLKSQIRNEARDRKRGMDYALIISIVGILTGALLVYYVSPVAGAFISVASLAVLVSKFIKGRTGTKEKIDTDTEET